MQQHDSHVRMSHWDRAPIEARHSVLKASLLAARVYRFFFFERSYERKSGADTVRTDFSGHDVNALLTRWSMDATHTEAWAMHLDRLHEEAKKEAAWRRIEALQNIRPFTRLA